MVYVKERGFLRAKRASARLCIFEGEIRVAGTHGCRYRITLPLQASVGFCDDCPHFLLPSSPTGCGRRKCSRTLNSVPGEGECPLWQQKRTPIWCPFLLAEKERFELSNPVTGYTISNRAPSTS